MNNPIDNITVNYAEYNYFKQLTKKERVGFFMELYEAEELRNNGLRVMLTELIVESAETKMIPENVSRDADFVEVMIDDDTIMIESNSLRAMRHIIYTFAETGYILRRDRDTEKMFKPDKVTRYLRIFKIIDQTSVICLN
ncbi:hypothetical protein UFOVP1307_45 [uncultured Caudovirales phage]|uniref:Uncharacterized protein n=1 Tax=uncultured Caudovirales phage TaxID=2100421 RepID=A0A6J5PP29_9CAUD|nr:hypothetical protein UFOVP651_78 [uncultured Caudovirales phage]CAB4170975.1 hypothetical protein UFOVP902_157 [uncultured Caudovirales phage]CAB4198037.1 hypothetical protein UFOVP1307_45 [uncultured Caudovirales phage]